MKIQGSAHGIASQSALPSGSCELPELWCQAKGGLSGYLSLSCAAVTEYHRLDNLKRRKCIAYSSGGWETQDQGPSSWREPLSSDILWQEGRGEMVR